jgi:Flp pilus assembly protein TadG
MKSLFKNNRGAAVVEFALTALPVFMFIFGIIQTAWVVWADNLLHASVDAATRCVAVGSATSPCQGTSGGVAAANTVFAPLSGATFTSNSSCSAGSTGLAGTYTVAILYGVINLTLTAQSCYPNKASS